MANLNLFKNYVTDEDRQYYWEVHRKRPSDEQILKEKRGLVNGIVTFFLLLGLFLVATCKPQYEWNLKHKLAAENLQIKCWQDGLKAVEAGEYSMGFAKNVRDECIIRAYGKYQRENVPKYYGWGKIRWRVR